MRVAILAGGWTGYNDAACRELVDRGVELLVVHEGDAPDTAYAAHALDSFAQELFWQGQPDAGTVIESLRQFAPDAVLMHSWHDKAYRAAMRSLPSGTLRVLWMDNVWRNTPKQWAGRLVAPAWVKPLYDAAMVPGDRTEFFARRLGFGESEVIRGSLSADTTLFGSPARTGAELASRATFFACLRLVHHKGADVLADAYRRYRDLADDPWALQIAGLGEMSPLFDGIDGVEMLGFRQPVDIALHMREASCLVVPSRIDPYGVVVHEGAVSGLPILTTYMTGAAPLFVQDGQNGWILEGGDAPALARAMAHMSSLPAERLGQMSAVSRSLGVRTSSAGWATTIHEQLSRRVADLRA